MEVNDIRALYLKVLGNIKSVMIGSEEVSSLIFSSMPEDMYFWRIIPERERQPWQRL